MPEARPITDSGLQMEMLERSKAVLELVAPYIPKKTGHASISLWEDHISVTVTDWDNEKQKATILANFWTDPRQEQMEVYHA